MSEEERAQRNGVFLNFKDKADMNAVTQTTKISQQSAAATLKNMQNNPRIYGFLRKRGYRREDIPDWVARPSEGEVQEIERAIAEGRTDDVTEMRNARMKTTAVENPAPAINTPAHPADPAPAGADPATPAEHPAPPATVVRTVPQLVVSQNTQNPQVQNAGAGALRTRTAQGTDADPQVYETEVRTKRSRTFWDYSESQGYRETPTAQGESA